jgi:hypothetical protein
MRIVKRMISILLLAATAYPGFAQSNAPDPISGLIDDKLLGAVGQGQTHNVTPATAMLALFEVRAKAGTQDPLADDIAAVINRQRTDLQLGAPSDSPRATSVLEKPGIADLLSLAIDRGAITKTTDGTGLTLSTTPYAVSTALGERDTPLRWNKAAMSRNLSISATFSSTDVTNGDFSSFTSGELKYIFFGNRSPRDAGLLREIRKKLGPIFRDADQAFDQACGGLNSVSDAASRMSTWLRDPLNATKTVADAHRHLDELVSDIAVDPVSLKNCVDVILEGEKSIRGGLDAVTESTKDYLGQHPHQLSVATLFVRDAMLSDYYAAKLLYGYDVAPLTINLNGEVSWNKNSMTTAGMPIRSLRAYSVEFGLTSKTVANGRLDGSIASKASRDKAADAKSVVVSEAKLNIHLTDIVRLPITLSYANRETQTIKQGWQLNVGLNALLDDVLRSLK